MSDLTRGDFAVGQEFLTQSKKQLRDALERIRHCIDQMSDEQVWWRPHESHNSIGNVLLHLAGNLRQWILSGVGGEPDVRDRPAEFSAREPVPTAELWRRLEEVGRQAEAVLDRTPPDRLLEPRRIQGFDETVLSALFDTLTHLRGHTQEIVYITRLQLGEAYRFAWVPTTPEQGAPSA
jgi:uncharacterized damage-inducible protein DinB